MWKPIAAAFALLTSPAAAWEFSPDPICTLFHQQGEAEVIVTYDAAVPLYTLTVTLPSDQRWAEGSFRIDFAGGMPPQIGTTRQIVSEDRRTLLVADRGFGNVLDGLGSAVIADMRIGRSGSAIELDGIDAPLAAFRACPDETPALS